MWGGRLPRKQVLLKQALIENSSIISSLARKGDFTRNTQLAKVLKDIAKDIGISVILYTDEMVECESWVFVDTPRVISIRVTYADIARFVPSARDALYYDVFAYINNTTFSKPGRITILKKMLPFDKAIGRSLYNKTISYAVMQDGDY